MCAPLKNGKRAGWTDTWPEGDSILKNKNEGYQNPRDYQ